MIRPMCDADPRSDRLLTDTTFKGIIDAYLDAYEPMWDIVRGARGVIKEPFTNRQIPLGTLAVRGYLGGEQPSGELGELEWMYPTHGACDRIAAVLICEKEGFDALLQHERIDRRYDLALANTKGISSKASRQLAREIGVPCFTLHDFDKNGFVMAGTLQGHGAVDMGLRLEDVEEWGLKAEEQTHENVYAAYMNLLENGATEEEVDFISEGERVELNMLSSPDFVTLVENKLKDRASRRTAARPRSETRRSPAAAGARWPTRPRPSPRGRPALGRRRLWPSGAEQSEVGPEWRWAVGRRV